MSQALRQFRTTTKREAAHGDNIWAATWCQGDLITGSLDGSVKLWTVSNSFDIGLKYTSSKQKVGVCSVATVQDGSLAAVCYQDSVIRLIDLISKQEVASIDPGLFEAYSICFSPADDVLVSGNNRGGINVWTMQDGHEKVATLETDNKQVLSTDFSIDGKLASAGIDGVLNVFDMTSQSITHKIEAHALPIRSIAFSPEGDLLYTSSDDRHANVYDVRSGSLINSFSHGGMAFSVDASPDHRHFAVGCADYSVSLWDLGMQKRVSKFSTHTDQVWGVSFDKSDPSGSRLASVGDDAAIQLYEFTV
ncbi:WD40-repeat-containing domain protein [Ochromonadaceae sp. CCMP2298]|nr:WD40-repeat-containing domain protein [Ochromonadaceae sp. CCMP2298]